MVLSSLIPNRLRTVRYLILSPHLVSVEITKNVLFVRIKESRSTSLEGI